ncbi:MAG: hypothetical protein JW795_04745 [Chitinivibrionales bacterium]|nr:hypothetical protein [Chitinivibrionales bacterium]
MIIQIYEIQTPHEAQQMICLGVDHIGSVIESLGEWKIPLLRETIQVVRQSNAKSSLIPLYTDVDIIRRILDYYEPDIIHFCEMVSSTDASAEAALKVQEQVKTHHPSVRIERSIPIPPPGTADAAEVLKLGRLFAPYCDLFLTDTLIVDEGHHTADSQPVSGFVGITGKTCDWDVAAQLVCSTPVPVILAGGISAENVTEGIRAVKPFGIDSCTRTNATDSAGRPVRFRKDIAKVRELVERARQAAVECDHIL